MKRQSKNVMDFWKLIFLTEKDIQNSACETLLKVFNSHMAFAYTENTNKKKESIL